MVGAVFVDGGFEAARKFVLTAMRQEVEAVLAGEVPEDSKSRLQELVQGMGGVPPQYRLVESAGSNHAEGFYVEVVMDGQVMGRGHGTRKLDAEKQAAQEVLHHLETSV